MAIAALVAGILAVLLLVVSWGLLFFVALPLAVAALMLGTRASHRGGGGGTARAAVIVGLGGIALSFAGAVFTALFLAGYWEH